MAPPKILIAIRVDREVPGNVVERMEYVGMRELVPRRERCEVTRADVIRLALSIGLQALKYRDEAWRLEIGKYGPRSPNE